MSNILFIFALLILSNDILGNKETRTQKRLKNLLDGVVSNFTKPWDKFGLPVNAMMVKSLQEGFGRVPINVEKMDLDNRLLLARGYYVFDEACTKFIMLNNLRMSHIPRPRTAFVSLSPPSMSVSAEMVLERIILVTEFYAFDRNKAGRACTSYSPFGLPELSSQSQMSIIAEDCELSGSGLLAAESTGLTMRHHQILLKKCKFSVEISNFESPPVISPYLTYGQRIRLERLMSNPLRWELETQLNSALYSFDLDIVFAKYPKELSLHVITLEKLIIEDVHNNLDGIIQIINKNAPFSRPMLLNDVQMFLNFTVNRRYESDFKISKVVLNGIDTLYSLHQGGAFLVRDRAFISERLGFSALVVTGDMRLRISGEDTNLHFSVEINDLTADVLILNTEVKVNVNFWRRIGVHIATELHDDSSTVIQNLLIAYIYDALPIFIENYLINTLTDVLKNDIDPDTTTTFDICKTSTTPKMINSEEMLLRRKMNALNEDFKEVNARMRYNSIVKYDSD